MLIANLRLLEPITCCTDLTEEERATILTSPEFLDFVEESSKIIQRALSDAYDYTRDYRIGADVEA